MITTRCVRPLCAAALALALTAASASAEAMRCDNRLIREGDPTSKVRALCGEPSQISESRAVRRMTLLRRAPRHWPHRRHFVPSVPYEEVRVERWVYNFGPHRFMRELQVADGRIARIERLGYGYREDSRDDSPEDRAADSE